MFERIIQVMLWKIFFLKLHSQKRRIGTVFDMLFDISNHELKQPNLMKTLKILLITMATIAPSIAFSQSRSAKTESGKSERTFQKKSSRLKSTTDTSDVTAIIKDSSNAESGPILNDNGNVSTTGTIDGRSSTGRPDADTTGSYTVKRNKKTIKTGGAVMPDTTKRRTRP